MPSDKSHRYTDLTAAPNEREWLVEFPAGGGVKVSAFDDAMELFDAMTLHRSGAFITLEHHAIKSQPLPDAFRFLASRIDARARLPLLGLEPDMTPVVVHSRHIHKLHRLGYYPLEVGQNGSTQLFGVHVVWTEFTDTLL